MLKVRSGVAGVLAGLVFVVSPAMGVFDGFEDGNTTSNLAWFDGNPGHGTDGGVVADPIRSGNLVWKAKGDEQAAKVIATRDFTPLAWEGFHASVEYLTTTSSRFTGRMFVGENWGPSDPSFTVFLVGLSHDITQGNIATLEMWEGHRNGPNIGYPKSFDLSLVPVNQWLRLELWHDPASGLVRGALLNSEGQVIVENSLTPLTFGGEPLISQIAIGAQELEWQYMDNPTLTRACYALAARPGRVGRDAATAVRSGAIVESSTGIGRRIGPGFVLGGPRLKRRLDKRQASWAGGFFPQMLVASRASLVRLLA